LARRGAAYLPWTVGLLGVIASVAVWHALGIRRCLTKSLGLRAYARAVREVLDETAKQTIVANRGVLPRPPST
jgi:hypothetical protein